MSTGFASRVFRMPDVYGYSKATSAMCPHTIIQLDGTDTDTGRFSIINYVPFHFVYYVSFDFCN